MDICGRNTVDFSNFFYVGLYFRFCRLFQIGFRNRPQCVPFADKNRFIGCNIVNFIADTLRFRIFMNNKTTKNDQYRNYN